MDGVSLEVRRITIINHVSIMHGRQSVGDGGGPGGGGQVGGGTGGGGMGRSRPPLFSLRGTA